MIKATKAGGIIFIAIPYSFSGDYKVGDTRVYSKDDIHRWCKMIGKTISIKYWKCRSGTKWRSGDRLSFPEPCSKKYADMVAIAVQVPVPSEEFKEDMIRCNYKLDDGWNRYYNQGWQDFKDRVDWVVKNVTKAPVLDLGCGPGVITNELNKKGIPTLGVDYSDKIIRIAKSRDVNVLWGSAEDIPCKDNSFNTVVVTETLEHVNDLDQTYKEIDRVLKPDGEIVITVPNGGSTNRFHLRTFSPEDFEQFRWKVDSCEVFKEWILVKCRK
jgi:SAM-dependent methyltransferase